MNKLLDFSALEKSSVVANSLMNRQRKCTGGNSYQKELSFDILEFLKSRLQKDQQTAWLDIACGEGNALIEAAENLAEYKNLKITGIDLAGMFQQFSAELKFLEMLETSFENYFPAIEFDLITCVHGLHYIGDKLGFLEKAVSMLKTDGRFLANLDLDNLKFDGGNSAKRVAAAELRKNGFEFDSKKHLVICRGKRNVKFGFEYLGADDAAGANYTGQAVVNSYYKSPT